MTWDLTIGFDTEYTRAVAVDDTASANENDNAVVSYQSAVYCPETKARISAVSYPKGPTRNDRITLGEFLSKAINDAIEQDALGQGALDSIANGKLTIAIVAHFSRADLPGFRDFKDIKRKFDGVRQTYASTSSPAVFTLFITDPSSKRRKGRRKRHIRASVRLYDTRLISPAGAGSLSKLGDLLGFPKLTLPDVVTKDGTTVPAITRMDLCREQHPQEFIRYASRDAELAVEWLLRFSNLSTAWGLDKPPSTIGSLAVRTFLKLADDDGVDIDPLLGLIRDSKGKPLHHPNELIHQSFIACTFHGGRNEAYAVGIFDGDFIDWDFAGAYTTALAQFRPFDWDNVFATTDLDTIAHLDLASFALVEFEFPADTRFPCLPVSLKEQGLIYPHKGASYCTGPELFLARNLGCRIRVLHAVVVPWAATDAPRPFVSFTQHINTERARFRKAHGKKGSADELLAKEAGNSLYGKTAQGVRLMRPVGIDGLSEAKTFDTRGGKHISIPPSRITQAAIASLTTGLMRAVLGEALAMLPDSVTVLSATTDGWLSTATPEQAAAATSGPVCRYFASLRAMVSSDGSDTIIEEKHRSSRVLTIKTRGAASLDATPDTAPILAKAGHRLNGTYETADAEANAFADLYRSRDADTVLTRTSFVSTSDQWHENSDLYEKKADIGVNLEYDLKRQPIGVHDHDGLIRFTTRPWPDLDTFLDRRSALDWLRQNRRFTLKTAADWSRCEGALGLTHQNSATSRTPFQNAVLEALALATDGFPPRRKDGRRGQGLSRKAIATFLTDSGVPRMSEDIVRYAATAPATPRETLDPATLSPDDHRLLEAIAGAFPAAYSAIASRWFTIPLPARSTTPQATPMTTASTTETNPTTPAEAPPQPTASTTETTPKSRTRGYRKWLLAGTASAICQTIKVT